MKDIIERMEEIATRQEEVIETLTQPVIVVDEDGNWELVD